MGISTFNVIDVETANDDRSSICQVGLVHVRNGEILDQWGTLIDPEEEFDPWNVMIHGIDEDTIAGYPNFPQAYEDIQLRLTSSILVSHTAFDRVAMQRAAEKYGLDELAVEWLDSARIVRRAWPDQFGKKGWGLKKVAKALKIKFRHHDAIEDARAAAEIVNRACDHAQCDIKAWFDRVNEPIIKRDSATRRVPQRKDIRREGQHNGALAGENIVFTGTLQIPRWKAADIASAEGCNVQQNITTKTTMLVVGDVDRRLLRGREKSRRQMKAAKLIGAGQDIQIVSEADFGRLMSTVS